MYFLSQGHDGSTFARAKTSVLQTRRPASFIPSHTLQKVVQRISNACLYVYNIAVGSAGLPTDSTRLNKRPIEHHGPQPHLHRTSPARIPGMSKHNKLSRKATLPSICAYRNGHQKYISGKWVESPLHGASTCTYKQCMVILFGTGGLSAATRSTLGADSGWAENKAGAQK